MFYSFWQLLPCLVQSRSSYYSALGLFLCYTEVVMLEQYFSRAYTGRPFILFSPAHLSAVAIVLGVCVLLAFGLRSPHLAPRHREIVRHTLAIFAIVNLIAWYVWEWYSGLSSLAFSLPIQICTSAAILCPLMLWR